jgi:hypothetical protein
MKLPKTLDKGAASIIARNTGYSVQYVKQVLAGKRVCENISNAIIAFETSKQFLKAFSKKKSGTGIPNNKAA